MAEHRVNISDPPSRAKPLGEAIRKHWGTEHGQHGVMDVPMGANSAQRQDRQGAAKLAAVRRLVVRALGREHTLKRGAKCKRMARD